jgi:hypothetical protein
VLSDVGRIHLAASLPASQQARPPADDDLGSDGDNVLIKAMRLRLKSRTG